jgi:hypothetical protein
MAASNFKLVLTLNEANIVRIALEEYYHKLGQQPKETEVPKMKAARHREWENVGKLLEEQF